MLVKLRLARFGRTHLPSYRIVAIDSRRRRDGRAIEYLGFYSPIADPQGNKNVTLQEERIKYWLSVGAQPSDRVAKLLAKGGMLPSIVYTQLSTVRLRNEVPTGAQGVPMSPPAPPAEPEAKAAAA